ncbi:TraX protein [Pseudobutyrivibrio sp. YE44]|uniref:TraX family protein n=1 Tax=Pseudobutyrivibrio sp. YE44 TaxID=1520802 RepID=UPI00088E91C3|nr:TraX family protein [Pseudobutyrivibrio sp. YE44]SDB12929.1 TraX protein [Pseudobutyrivibrio sp. YE44]
MINEKGLTGFNLKYLAVVFMVLDHIHYFFEFTGKVPIWFSWIGRMAAPLFLFCFVEGFIHTHNRKKYFLKIYLISIFMGLIQFGFYNVLSPAVRGDGFFPMNGMLSSFTILFVVMQGIDWIKQKKYIRGLVAVIVPLVLPLFMYYLVFQPFINAGNQTGLIFANMISLSVLPLHTGIADGGTITVLEGMVLLIFSYCKNKKIRIYVWALFSLLINVVSLVLMGVNPNMNTLFFEAYEWMSIFSIILMLCYNGERGKGNAKFFYWFYPAHVYVLYGLSIVVYMVIR